MGLRPRHEHIDFNIFTDREQSNRWISSDTCILIIQTDLIFKGLGGRQILYSLDIKSWCFSSQMLRMVNSVYHHTSSSTVEKYDNPKIEDSKENTKKNMVIFLKL